MLAAISVIGIYFTLKSRFFMPKAIKKTVSDTLGSLSKRGNGISPFSAVATALGGTVGVGSIVGVGYGIAVGGAGSVFWMWVCSFFGMGLKYAEIKIALADREQRNGSFLGGAPFRLNGLGHKKLALFFCVLCVAASFGTGNVTQTGAIASFLGSAGVSRAVSAAVCVLVVALAVFGGRKRIAGINSVIVPIASAVYIIACLAILLSNAERIPDALSRIITSAFGLKSAFAGFSAAAISKTLREGFARSLFSNEAGMGSSPLAHATSAEENPSVQAEWGIFEIFFDTFIVSTLTALCLLCLNSVDAVSMLSSQFGSLGVWCFGALFAVFAFASVISWCYYAECCISFALPKSRLAPLLYRIAFSLASAAGAFLSGGAVWDIADILNALMLLPNMFLLLKCRKEIERIG
ncbi:MAG: sodium:alanine symporter family protein [Clostridia bacterium]|nr:sodium:alanine symporter family protein [Clostridia bacterium]